jgi:hypothetical protein
MNKTILQHQNVFLQSAPHFKVCNLPVYIGMDGMNSMNVVPFKTPTSHGDVTKDNSASTLFSANHCPVPLTAQHSWCTATSL